MPYKLAQSAARVLALAMIKVDASSKLKIFIMDGSSLDIGNDEEAIVTYERRKRKPVNQPQYLAVDVTPVYDMERN